MRFPTWSCGKLANGCEIQVDQESNRARDMAKRMGMMSRITEELRGPGIGIRIAVGIGRDEGWLRAIVACTTDPDLREVWWVGFAVSPIRHDSRQSLLDVVSASLRADPKALRIVYR